MSATAPEAAPEAAAPAKKSKLPLILAIVGLTVGLGGAGGGFYMWKAAKHAAEAAAEDEGEDGEKPKKAEKSAKKSDKAAKAEADKKAKDKKPSVFVPLEVFTVNLQSQPGREHFLQVGLVLEMADQPLADALKANMPIIRSSLLLLLASKTAEELGKPEGKDTLANELLERVKKPTEGSTPNTGVERVHYSAFIIQ